MDVLTAIVAAICLFLILLGLFFSVHHLSQAMIQMAEEFKRPQNDNIIDFNAIKEELLGIVEDTVANLQPPSAIDHLLGAFAQFAQVKLMQATGIDAFQAQGFEIADSLNGPEPEAAQEAV